MDDPEYFSLDSFQCPVACYMRFIHIHSAFTYDPPMSHDCSCVNDIECMLRPRLASALEGVSCGCAFQEGNR